MKRLLAGWLAAMILLAGSVSLAENPDRKETADIEESMITVEGETLGTLSENILMISSLLQDEEVRALLKMEEVTEVTSEIIWRVLLWMYQNRPVTMKILTALDVNESDQQCISRIWDSSDRIIAAYNEYLETEDGKQLDTELKVLMSDQEFRKSLADFSHMLTSDELLLLLEALKDTVTSDQEIPLDGPLTRQVKNQEAAKSSLSGRMTLRALYVLEQSEWARESLPNLMNNKNLQKYLLHLYNNKSGLDLLIQEELKLLLSDAQMMDFLKKTLSETLQLYKILSDSRQNGSETDSVNQETNVEEVAP